MKIGGINIFSKHSLRHGFRRLAAVAVGIAATYATVILTFYNSKRGDPLTANEKKLATLTFGPRFNADKVRKHFKSTAHYTYVLKGKVAQVPPLTSHIDIFKPQFYSSDYALSDDRRFGMFIHELEHCDQNQTQLFCTKKIGDYTYTLDTRTRFEDLGIEQRACVMEDYARLFLYPAKSTPYNYKGANTPEFRGLLIAVVETHKPHLKKLREALQNIDWPGDITRIQHMFNIATGLGLLPPPEKENTAKPAAPAPMR